MIGQEVKCQNSGCDVVFIKKTHNQKYHDNECCRLATNAKIMEKYYEKQARRKNKPRFCDTCTTAKLSRYNENTTCNACLLQREVDRATSVSARLNSVIVA